MHPQKYTIKNVLFLFAWLIPSMAMAEVDLIGKWSAVADLPNSADPHESTLSFEKTDSGIKGSSKSDDADREFSKVTVDGSKVAIEFGMDYNGTPITIKIHAEEKEPGTLTGKWSAYTEDGTEQVVENWKAVKEKTEEEKKAAVAWLVGDWDAKAMVNDNALESVLTITSSSDQLSGKFVSERGEVELSKVTAKPKAVTIDFTMENNGNSRDIRINAESKKAHHLEGKWVIFDDAGQEAASGEWSAVKRVPLDLVGIWDVEAVSNEGDEREAELHVSEKEGKLTGVAKLDGNDVPLKELKVKGKSVTFKVDVAEGDITAALEGKETQTGVIDGEWAGHDDSGNEVVNGSWSARKRVEEEKKEEASAALSAESLKGNWAISVKMEDQSNDYTLKFSDDDGLKAVLVSPRSGDHAAKSVEIKDEKVIVSVPREYGGQALTIIYTGALQDGVLSGDVAVEGYDQFSGTFSGKRVE